MNNSLQKLDALNRGLIGFDDLFNTLERRFANSAVNYPPYNVVKIGENQYDIDIAVTGFEKDEITVQVEANELTIRGVGRETEDRVEKEYIFRGLALRDFERTFALAEHVKVISAEIKNGILKVSVERVIPEELKPRIIDIVEVK